MYAARRARAARRLNPSSAGGTRRADGGVYVPTLAQKIYEAGGAFHPHDGVLIDFHLLKTLSEAHVRNGIAELIKISSVEHLEVFEMLEKHSEDLIKSSRDLLRCKFFRSGSL